MSQRKNGDMKCHRQCNEFKTTLYRDIQRHDFTQREISCHGFWCHDFSRHVWD